MYNFGTYRIDIIYTNSYYDAGNVRATLNDFQSLQIIDVLNDTGSFKITSTTKTRCPFQPFDGVIIYRDGVVIYTGILDKIEEEYIYKYSCWQWTVSGKNFNSILKRLLVYPDELRSNITFANRTLSFSSYNDGLAIKEIIDYNVKDGINDGSYRWNQNFHIIGAAYLKAVNYKGLTAEYRFDNVFDVVMGIANSNEYAIRPIYNPTTKKIQYYIDEPVDKSNTVIFSFDDNNLNSFKIINEPHEETFILASYNSDDSYTEGAMWQTVAQHPIPTPTGSWRDFKEVLWKPKKEDFQGYFTYAVLDDLARKEAENRAQTSSEYYEADINTIAGTQFIYGYEMNSARSQFTNDYRLGDKIGILVGGTTYTGKVTRMEFSVSYGKETIKPIIGDILRGQFKGIFKNLNNLNKSTTKTDNTEVS